jgi:hypothetical protein
MDLVFLLGRALEFPNGELFLQMVNKKENDEEIKAYSLKR